MIRRRGISWQFFVVLLIGIIIVGGVVLAYRSFTDSPPPLPTPPPPAEEIETPKPPQVQNVREEAWKRIEPHLAAADDKAQAAAEQFIQDVGGFFDGHEDGIFLFAEAALGWTSKWKAITSREEHRKFLAEKFAEYIFPPEDLAAVLESAAASYSKEIHALQNQLLVDVRADLQDLPLDTLPAFKDETTLMGEFDSILTEVMPDIATDLGADVGQVVMGGLLEIVIKQTITAMATRLGISGTTLGLGAGTSWASAGATLAIGIAADFLLGWIYEWLFDPEGDVADEVTKSLKNVQELLINGDPDAWTEYYLLVGIAQNNADETTRASASEVVVIIEQSGALGLTHALEQMADLQRDVREQALRKLVNRTEQ